MEPNQKSTQEGDRLIRLIERAKAGDQQAYTALYEATEREVYRTVRAMLRSEELARDVQQEVYVYAFTHLDSLREPEKLRAWLRGIAVNQSYSALRQTSPILFSELENGEGRELPELADLSGDTEPELRLERKETARYVNEILDDLTDGQRAVVAMYYYEQLPVSEIARDLGVAPGTVKTQLFRSRKKIETAVKDLEAQGVKLCGLAPLPFLVSLLKKLTPAAEQSKTVLAGTLTEAGVAPAAGTAAVQAVAFQVGRSFFETALGKVVLGVIAAAAIGGGVAGYRWYQNHMNVGDYQPPTETFEINLHYDTDEDLTTEPTEELVDPTDPTDPTDPETNEDLTPEPTDPAETTDPTDPAETTDPTDPTNPTDPAPQPTGPAPTDPTDPTDPEPVSEASKVLSCQWRDSSTGTLYDLQPMSTAYIIVTVQGSGTPSLSTDNDSVVKLTYQGAMDPADGKTKHQFEAIVLGSGLAHIYCELNGVVTNTLTLDNPEHPPRVTDVSITILAQEDLSVVKKVGDRGAVTVWSEGDAAPVVYTDDPSVLEIIAGENMGGSAWYENMHTWAIRIIGPGTANIYVDFEGAHIRTATITAEE